MNKVTFLGNTAENAGAGMYSYFSSPTLTNVTFSRNTAVMGPITPGSGGGMYNESSYPMLKNVTFSENSAIAHGGGIYNTISDPTLMNCIFWGDVPEELYSLNSSPVIFYSDIWMSDGSVYPGTGNLNKNPLLGSLSDHGGFILTYSLFLGSPVIDAGNPDPATCPATDARGETRPFDGDRDGIALCDMGAYESQVVPLMTFFPVGIK